MKLNTRKVSTIFAIALMGAIFFNCAGNKGPDLSPEAGRKTIKNIPEWFIDTPIKDGYKYHSATATSQDMQLAINKASLDAANVLAGQMESEMNALVKRAQEETGLGPDSHVIDQFSQTQNQVITLSLKDYRIAKKEIQEEKSDVANIYRAYVLIEWDEGASQKRLLSKIKADEQLYTIMRSTELFDEMERKVEDYRNRNK